MLAAKTPSRSKMCISMYVCVCVSGIELSKAEGGISSQVEELQHLLQDKQKELQQIADLIHTHLEQNLQLRHLQSQVKQVTHTDEHVPAAKWGLKVMMLTCIRPCVSVSGAGLDLWGGGHVIFLHVEFQLFVWSWATAKGAWAPPTGHRGYCTHNANCTLQLEEVIKRRIIKWLLHQNYAKISGF